jgi:type II secretory pathway component GspD/PulD (secretin)
MSAIRSRRIDTNETKVEAIKYADGTGMVIVSAEQYRFEKLENGMTIDQVVEMLDRPNLSAQAGRRFFVYYAKYFDATTLANLIREVGIMHANDDMELDGVDTVRADNGMNALLFFCTPISQKNIESLLAQYDGPASEAMIEYTIYEVDYENDGNVGVDFQAWKNGPGQDLFGAGATYLNGWDPLIGTMGNATDLVKDAHVNYINFNPKWNSKYLDFLVSKSKAKVVTSGSIDVWNKGTGTIESVTRFPVIGDGEVTVDGEDVATETTTTVTDGGTPTTTTTSVATPTSTTEKSYKKRTTSNAEFGFHMTVLPEVYGKSTILSVNMTNTNLLGFNSDGAPRTSRTSMSTTLQVNNDGNTFYIGGLEKSDLVRSVNKVPYLGDIPVLGWLFSGESETVKKSQLVAVLTVKPIIPTTEVPGELKKLGEETQKRIDDFGIKALDENEYGFDQYLLDKDK